MSGRGRRDMIFCNVCKEEIVVLEGGATECGCTPTALIKLKQRNSELWKDMERMVNSIAKQRFGLELPMLYTFTQDGVIWSLNVYATLQKVGLEEHD